MKERFHFEHNEENKDEIEIQELSEFVDDIELLQNKSELIEPEELADRKYALLEAFFENHPRLGALMYYAKGNFDATYNQMLADYGNSLMGLAEADDLNNILKAAKDPKNPDHEYASGSLETKFGLCEPTEYWDRILSPEERLKEFVDHKNTDESHRLLGQLRDIYLDTIAEKLDPNQEVVHGLTAQTVRYIKSKLQELYDEESADPKEIATLSDMMTSTLQTYIKFSKKVSVALYSPEVLGDLESELEKISA